jgi:uncharacterized protein (DUF1697 family)
MPVATYVHDEPAIGGDVPERSWLGLLRGMNIGSRRLTNDELVAAVQHCGCSDVAAYQASGNIVFNDGRPEGELTTALTDGLAGALGYPVPVFLRKAGEVRTIAAATPFTESQLAASRSKPQVVFLHAEPPEHVLLQVVALVPGDDVVVAAGRELHWLPASGVADSTLDFRRLDQLTGGTTVRTRGTLQRLASKYL